MQFAGHEALLRLLLAQPVNQVLQLMIGNLEFTTFQGKHGQIQMVSLA